MITTVISMRDICVILATASIHVYYYSAILMHAVYKFCMHMYAGIIHAASIPTTLDMHVLRRCYELTTERSRMILLELGEEGRR